MQSYFSLTVSALLHELTKVHEINEKQTKRSHCMPVTKRACNEKIKTLASALASNFSFFSSFLSLSLLSLGSVPKNKQLQTTVNNLTEKRPVNFQFLLLNIQSYFHHSEGVYNSGL